MSPAIDKNIHKTAVSIILDDEKKDVLIHWTYNPFELPTVISVLDGNTEIAHRMDENAWKVVNNAVNRAAFDLPIEVQIRK